MNEIFTRAWGKVTPHPTEGQDQVSVCEERGKKTAVGNSGETLLLEKRMSTMSAWRREWTCCGSQIQNKGKASRLGWGPLSGSCLSSMCAYCVLLSVKEERERVKTE